MNIDIKSFVSAPYSEEEFSEFLHGFLPNFISKREKIKPSIGTVFNKDGVNRLGEDKTLSLSVYEFRHGRKDPRVTLTRDAFKVLKNYEERHHQRALAVFVNDKNKEYRFSLITSEVRRDPETQEIKKADWSNPRRFSFVLGGGITRKTPEDRLKDKVKTIDDLKKCFSVEALTNSFYEKVKEWFLRAKKEVKFPGADQFGTTDEEHQSMMTLRLITRLIFIWFLKEKGLVPEELFDEGKIDKLLNRKKFSALSPYYRAIMQNLFFATLNTPIDKREWLKDHEYHGMNSKRGDQEYFRYRDFFKGKDEQAEFRALCDKIPFVNGGLFENLDGVKADDDFQRDNEKRVDCFSEENRNLKPWRLKVPDSLFFGEKGLIEILKQYNFTIEENTPNDEDVALDPELLGCVFEGLLSHVNSGDTEEVVKKQRRKETEKKKSGSYYTPREIVDYMVSESLKAYLTAKVNGSECLESLFAPDSDEEAKYKDNDEFKNAVANELGKIKVLDPACGSGAFPMGILSKMIQILGKVGKIDIKKPHEIYKKKLKIIRDCIYGVDIQNIAVQISKLRFFISLLCEQVVDEGDKKNNYGIEPLPNLETKIVCADTLKKLQESEYDFAVDKKINELKEKLFETRKEYFSENGKADKRKLRRADKATREKLGEKITEFVQDMIDRRIAEEERKINQWNKDLEKVKKPEYEERTAPQQQDMFGMLDLAVTETPPPRKIKIDVNAPERTRLEREIYKSEKIIARLKWDRENDPSIMEAKAVAEWNPYDPSKCAEFFSPKWMFGATEVFDIVIGNPPYIQLQKEGGKLSKKYEGCGYETFDGDGDIYCLFYERGQQLLKDCGHLCFITSNKWMRAGYGEKTREFFATRTNPKLLIDFPGVKIFPNASVDPNILLFQKSENEHNTLCATVTDKGSVRCLSVFLEQKNTTCDFSGGDNWVILSDIEKSIKRKIEEVGTPLKDWGNQINRGILTGCNDAFIISEEKCKEILANCEPKEERKRTKKLIRPILKGEDIERYGHRRVERWLIHTHNGVRSKKILPVDIKEYPAVKAHLDQYWRRLKSRDDKGITPYNLRNCAYLEEFNKPKIMYSEIVQSPKFYFDENEHLYPEASAFIMTGENLEYLTDYLNSYVVAFFFKRFYAGGGLGERGYRYKKQFLEKLPVPKKVFKVSDEKIFEVFGFSREEIKFIKQVILEEFLQQDDVA